MTHNQFYLLMKCQPWIIALEKLYEFLFDTQTFIDFVVSVALKVLKHWK